jgi:dolichol-phosphate mannosyltransferase
MDLSIIIPTYNEAENIVPLLAQVFQVLRDNDIDGEVIVVDDDSPDRTWDLATGLMDRYDGLQVIRRTKDRGLSTAVLCGFGVASAPRLLVMDADLSHPPSVLPKLYRALDKADVAVASRYVKGGGVKDWPLRRRIVSKGATLIARLLTKVKDPMSGFFAIRKEVLEEDADLDPKGYKILLEVLVKGRYEKVEEVPFVFEDRRAGDSKLSAGVCTDYLSHVWSLLKESQSTSAQLARFCVVGGLGILVNLAILWLLVELGAMWYMAAATVSFMAAVTFNFIGNKVFAFRDDRKAALTVASQYVKFIMVSVGSLLVNLAVLFVLVDVAGLWYVLGQVVAIVTATAGNFLGNKLWTFGTRTPAPARVKAKGLESGALKAIVMGHTYGFEGKKDE